MQRKHTLILLLAAASSLIGHTQNVGIGTTAPKEKLDISKALTFHTGGSIGIGFNWHYDGLDRFSGYNGSTAHNGKLLFASNGNLSYWASNAQGAEGAVATMNHLFSVNRDGLFMIGNTVPNTRLSISPNVTESKITLWDGGHAGHHYGFGVSDSRLNYEVNAVTASHVFMATGKNGSGTELMRIQGNGKVGIGTNSPIHKFQVHDSYTAGPVVDIRNLGNANAADGLNITAGMTTGAGAWYIGFKRADGVTIGMIQQGGTSSVFYSTTSDKRLKNSIVPTKRGVADVMKIAVKDYVYNADAKGVIHTGILAQELHEIFPAAVSVGTDEARPWGIDYGKLTPLLIKAVQEQQVQIDLLSAENNKLKNLQQAVDDLQLKIAELQKTVMNLKHEK